MKKTVVSFIIVVVLVLICSSNRSKYDFNYSVSLLDSIDLDSL